MATATAKDHPIRIVTNPNRVRVQLGGKTVVDTTHALTLFEATYPGVQYVPRADADMSLLTRTTHHTHCPYKGDASYYSIAADGRQRRERGVDLRAAVPRRRRDRRLSGVLSEQGRDQRGEGAA